MEGIFDQLINVDTVKAFKTDPQIYQMGIKALRVKPNEICFCLLALLGRRCFVKANAETSLGPAIEMPQQITDPWRALTDERAAV